MDSIRLDLDGTISQYCSGSSTVYPHSDFSPFCMSVALQHSNDSALTKPSKTKRKHGISRKQYNFLCWKVIAVLFLEIGILLSILVTYNCKFYDVAIVDGHDVAKLQVGLFRYSLASDRFAEAQCSRYKNVTADENTAFGQWLRNVTAMLSVTRMLAISAPILASLGWFCVSLQVFMPKRFEARWSTSAILFLAGLFQILSIISFDGQSTW